jgi:hypothetical protein
MCGLGPCTSPTPCGRCERGAAASMDEPSARAVDVADGLRAGRTATVRASRSLTVLSPFSDDRLTAD